MGYMEEAAAAIIAAKDELSAAPCQEVMRQVEAAAAHLTAAGDIVLQQCSPRLAMIKESAESLQALILASQDAFTMAAQTVASGGSLSDTV